MSETILIKGCRIVGDRKIRRGDIEIADGRISAIGKLEPKPGSRIVKGAGMYAIPGFVDIHTHGAIGFDLTAGKYNTQTAKFDSSPEIYRECLPAVMKMFAQRGVTRALLATVAADPKRLEEVLGYTAEFVLSPANGADGCRMEGTMIEGTFIKLPECAGAQNPAAFREPSKQLFDGLNRAAKGTIRYVNVVPEYGEPAIELTRYLAQQGIMVGAGHTRCPASQVRKAIDAGVRSCVHFTNGPTGQSYKPFEDGDVFEEVMRNDVISAELIADGFHVNPAYILDILKRKGPSRTLAVTDSMFATKAPNLGAFELSGIPGALDSSGKFLRVTSKPNTLFGSVLEMNVAFSNLVSWMTQPMKGIWNDTHKPLSLEKAILTATELCSTTPARLLAMTKIEDAPTGRLDTGVPADLFLGKVTGTPGNYSLAVKHTFVRGKQVV